MKSNELRAHGTICVSLRLIMAQHAIQRRVHTLYAPFIPNSGKCKQAHAERLHQYLCADGSEGGVETKGLPRAGGTSGE